MRSYSSWIAGLRYRAPNGLNRGRYCAKHLRPGVALDLVPEPDNPQDDEGNAVALKHAGRHLGYIPARHQWVGRALSEGTALRCVVTGVEVHGWLFATARAVALRVDIIDSEGGSAATVIASDAHRDIVQRNREQRARDACMDGLRVLNYLALSDDALTAEDLDIEASYIDARLVMMGIGHDPTLRETVMAVARGLIVSKRAFCPSGQGGCCGSR